LETFPLEKMCDPILVTRPHDSWSSRENMTPSRGTSPLASSKVLAHPPRLKESLKQYEDMIIAVLQKNLSSCEIKA